MGWLPDTLDNDVVDILDNNDPENSMLVFFSAHGLMTIRQML